MSSRSKGSSGKGAQKRQGAKKGAASAPQESPMWRAMFDANPEDVAEQVAQQQAAATGPAADAEPEVVVPAGEPGGGEPEAPASAAPAAAPAVGSSPVVGEAPVDAVLADGTRLIERDGRLVVRDKGGNEWPPQALDKMTVSFTRLEAFRLRQYAESRRMAYVDVLRERLADIMEGEPE